MQNKLFSLTMMLLTGVAVIVNTNTVSAQTAPAAQPEIKKEVEVIQPENIKLPDPTPAMPAPNGQVNAPIPEPEMAQFPALKPIQPETEDLNSPLGDIPKSPDEIRSENKRRMEEELKNTTTAGKSIVDFPNRSSLGSSELAPLPTLNESIITGPSPMAQSVSSKDLPTEQLLGSITPAIFQEMADLERGNTFLKLQIEKERMKNDLERLKSDYREKRLGEIAKREDVVRTRIKWWQEQEKIRLEVEKKEKEAAELAQKIAEQEANRDQIRKEALNKMATPKADENPQGQPADKGKVAEEKPAEKTLQPIDSLYTIDSIKGVGRKLSAKLKNAEDNTVIVVKKDDILPSGHVVREVKKDGIVVMFGNRREQLSFRPVTQ